MQSLKINLNLNMYYYIYLYDISDKMGESDKRFNEKWNLNSYFSIR
jgi:hypothetical protein